MKYEVKFTSNMDAVDASAVKDMLSEVLAKHLLITVDKKSLKVTKIDEKATAGETLWDT